MRNNIRQAIGHSRKAMTTYGRTPYDTELSRIAEKLTELEIQATDLYVMLCDYDQDHCQPKPCEEKVWDTTQKSD